MAVVTYNATAVANLQLHAFAWFRVKVKSLSTSVSLMITLD